MNCANFTMKKEEFTTDKNEEYFTTKAQRHEGRKEKITRIGETAKVGVRKMIFYHRDTENTEKKD